MKDILSIFSWVASNLVESLCPNNIVTEKIQEELKRYRESAYLIAGKVKSAWEESIQILEMSLGGGSWLAPLSRKQIAERFEKEIIRPFATQNNLEGEELEKYLQAALSQCQELKKIANTIIHFHDMNEEVLLEALVESPIKGVDREDLGVIIIDLIQTRLPHAKELLALLWYRNILLEGIVTHFNFQVARNPKLAEVVNRLDHQRVRQDLLLVKTQMQELLQEGNYIESGKLAARLSKLASVDEIFQLQEDYKSLYGTMLSRFDKVDEDHIEIKDKLDQALHLLDQLQQIQQKQSQSLKITSNPDAVHSSPQELQIIEELTSIVGSLGWQQFPESQRGYVANSMAVSLYCSEKVQQALTLIEEALAENIHSPDLYFNYFQALQVNNQNEKAVEIYNKYIENRTDYALFPPDQYKMIDILGRGVMGVVYKALDLQTKRHLAIKVLQLPEEWYPGAKARFIQATKTATELHHPNIVNVYALHNEDTETPCMVMEYLDGVTLTKQIYDHGPYSLEKSLEIAYNIAQGLEYAHQQYIVHRDLRPGNIILMDRGPVIIDFGLAKSIKNSNVSKNKESYYTLYYSSPEQRRDFHNVDIRSDIYSFGKTLYYLFTGEEPYDIDWNDLPEIVRPIIKKATRKRPENRYQNMHEVIEDILKAKKGEKPSEPTYTDTDRISLTLIEEYLQTEIPQTWIDPSQARWEDIEKGEIFYHKDQSTMIYIPKGEFLMGNDNTEYNQAPTHIVYLDDYFIDKYLVTNKQYALFLQAMSEFDTHPTIWCHPDEPWDKTHIPQFWYRTEWTQDDYPVVGLDWWDAYAYTKWAGKSLPTEAEWEKAARGPEGNRYPWGNDPPSVDLCNYNIRYSHTTSVKLFPKGRSYYGCYDMAGNVGEWCVDWYDPEYYKKSLRINPRGASVGTARVVRGGHWACDAYQLQTTTRFHELSPNDYNPRTGFRCIKIFKSVATF
ncbi:MAG: SUMF1/EgtB/PvdO family nonheme iron enzyme [Planctomycetes bacterium]|jgi:serine/threonine-protein kinase|nr:SUMF1/EgtB/PvdO family nonheme iron enzyme [Planctomycetota bacterium]HPY74569.1 SUMF1/EgtB/PvdO family nonheme iron enzyme [Planctomycetota bacterium]HQB01567.1 SUMF1/EgtB/PvdO family nonheme iron enzyme [Planctomycetota bacterium]